MSWNAIVIDNTIAFPDVDIGDVSDDGSALAVEIDMKLDMLSYLKDVKVPGRNIQHPEYNRVFDETAQRIYKAVTGRVCPESVRVE